MSTEPPQIGDMNIPLGKGTIQYNMCGKSLFAEINKQLGLLPGYEGLNNMKQLEQSTQTPGSGTPLEHVRREAEVIATDVITSFDRKDELRVPNRFCKTMRRTVQELSERHDIAFKGMVDKLNIDEGNAFQTFVSVTDEIFEDGQINWGRIVAVYAFAARLASYCRTKHPGNECEYDERIALYVGRYVGNKLGKWIVDNGAWDAFSDYFPEQGQFEDKLWKGLIFTAVGFGALATVFTRY